MRELYQLALRFRSLFRKRRVEDELNEELRFHVDNLFEEYLGRGMSPDEARRAALRELGGLNQIKEECRDARRVDHLENLARDLRYGLRTLRRNPGFAAVALVSLALGIGANTAIFQLLDAVRLRLLPVERPRELAEIHLTNAHGRMGSFYNGHAMLTNAIWEKLRARHDAFSGLFAWAPDQFNLAPRGEVHLVRGIWVSGDFFTVLGLHPALGRLFTAAGDRPGCGAPGVVVSYAFWQRELGGDPAAIGSPLTIDYRRVPVLGVAPAAFSGLEVGRSFDLALPICAQPMLGGEDNYLDTPYDWWLTVMGRLKPGWTLARAGAWLGSISPGVFEATLPSAYDAVHARNYLGFKMAAYPAERGISSMREDSTGRLGLLLGLAGLVLLIACANLANLTLARASGRAREIGVRLALGASRRRLIRQLLAESLLLAAAGAAAGLVLAGVLARFLVSFLSTPANRVFLNLDPDWRVLGFTAAMTVLATVLFGWIPALRATRVAPGQTLSAAGRGLTADRRRFGLRRALVVSQVALSLVLLAGALLFARSLRNLLALDLGFQRTGILVATVDLSQMHLTAGRRLSFKKDLLRRLRATPGMDAAADVFIVPTSGSSANRVVWMDGASSSSEKTPWFNWVSPGYFAAMGTPLLAGRDFTDGDGPGAPRVAIVNEAFARQVAGAANPVGRRFWQKRALREPQIEYEIVGLVKDTKYQDIREAFAPIVYLPSFQVADPDPYVQIVLRSGAPLADVISRVKQAFSEASPDASLDFRPLPAMLDEELVAERLMATLSGFFGALAALLACVGLYGVMSYAVVRRTNEIGIRMTLGAGRREILFMVIREAAVLVCAGLLAGLVLALAFSRAAATMLFGLKPYDPLTLLLAGALLAAVAAAATYWPARRATRVDPLAALRYE